MHHTHQATPHPCTPNPGPHGPRAWFAGHIAPDFAAWAESARARHACSRPGGHRKPWERGFGGPAGRERLFDAGDLKLVILKLLSEQPSYGYQLIKTMEERLAGGYTPSAGVIYPTLTLLEEEGLASAATSDTNKKVYTVTPEGTQYLQANKGRLDAIFARLEEKGEHYERGRSPEILKAFMNLRGAVMARIARRTPTPDQVARIAEAINAAANSIDEL